MFIFRHILYTYAIHYIYYSSIQIALPGLTSSNKNRTLPTPCTHHFIVPLLFFIYIQLNLSTTQTSIYTHILGDTPRIHPSLRASLFEPVHRIRISATMFSSPTINSRSTDSGFYNFVFYRFRLLQFRVLQISAFTIPCFTDSGFYNSVFS